MSSRQETLAAWNTGMNDFAALYRQIPPARRTESIDGGWSARQILEHLFDTELVFSTRLRSAIATPGSTILPFDQDLVAERVPNGAIPDELLLDALSALRAVNMTILGAVPEETWEQTVIHPEYGTQTLADIGNVFGNHVGDHASDLKSAGLGTQLL